MLFDPKGGYRKLLKSPLLKKGALMTALILSMGNIQTLHAESATGNLQNAVLPKETAEKFGELHILYNDRICPVQTFALDFCKKIYGARSYLGIDCRTGTLWLGILWKYLGKRAFHQDQERRNENSDESA